MENWAKQATAVSGFRERIERIRVVQTNPFLNLSLERIMAKNPFNPLPESADSARHVIYHTNDAWHGE